MLLPQYLHFTTSFLTDGLNTSENLFTLGFLKVTIAKPTKNPAPPIINIMIHGINLTTLKIGVGSCSNEGKNPLSNS